MYSYGQLDNLYVKYSLHNPSIISKEQRNHSNKNFRNNIHIKNFIILTKLN